MARDQLETIQGDASAKLSGKNQEVSRCENQVGVLKSVFQHLDQLPGIDVMPQ